MTLMDIYQTRLKSGDLKPDAAQRQVLPEFERLRQDLLHPAARGWFRKKTAPPRGIYLWGGVGRGKSMLMDMFVQEIGAQAQRVHFHEFMQSVHEGMTKARKKGVTDAILPVADQIARNTRCLALDEMQITDITDAMIVGRLFERLFAQGICTVTTSNQNVSDLYKDGLNRDLFLPFIALLKKNMCVIRLASATDYRQNLLRGMPVYFTPLGSQAKAQINQIWQDLTGGAGVPLTLTVKGRCIELPAFKNGVARASFSALCAKPLGAADYLSISNAVRVLILEDIPLLSAQNANEAKRFVTLIDTLYEANVRLIASAAARPEALYVAGKGSFEFQRTASRLHEMQSGGWIK